jgi:DNA repair exonuclease SbcCD nuclease subunit
MIITEDNKKIELLGDPHLGRSFVHNVPLNRRGEREASMWVDFTTSITKTTADLHVCLGDLFDKWMVSFDLIIATAQAYKNAAVANPNTTYIILKGNHDWIKDLERKSAFDVFSMLMAGIKNVVVVDRPFYLGRLLFYPWLPSAVEINPDGLVAAFGHWDTEFGEHNMVPTKLGIPKLYTGHVHKPTTFTRDGTEVVVVGSMQPLAHGEEADDSLYVTLRLDQIEDAGDLTNKCVRILLASDELFDAEINCLQLVVKREKEDDADDSPTVTLGDFDMEALFRKAFSEASVSADRTDAVLNSFLARRIASGA